MFSVAESDALHARVQSYIRATAQGAAHEDFDGLALAIARYQAAHIPVIARLAAARSIDLMRAQSADAIPAVPSDVFRLARVAAHPASLDTAVFHTSGTSHGVTTRGEHAFRTTSTYELSALTWSRPFLFPDDLGGPAPFGIVIAPDPATTTDSSLGFMLDRLLCSFCAGRRVVFQPSGGAGHSVDVETLVRVTGELAERSAPAIVFATSFALVHTLESLGSRSVALPRRSRIMQTGGFKGRSREVPAEALRSEVARAFGVSDACIVGEYGMTELSSPLYEATLAAQLGQYSGPARHGLYAAPPWMRLTAVDPESLAPVPTGEVGLARIVDLANVDSAVAILTADRVRVVDGGVELLGRAPNAEPRGCSIAIDDMLGRSEAP